LRYHAVATVSGQISRNSMAVSPDGTKLAYALVRRPAADGPRRGQCLFANALVVVALATQTRHVFTGSFPVAIQDLVWAPDSRHLFYSGAPSAIGTGDYDTHELDTAESTHDLVSADARPYLTRTAGTSYGPVFSWHGQPVTIIDGTMRELNGHGGVGEALATQFPTGTIESVSSDPTGNHLLISVNAGPQKIYHETAAGTTITTRTEYLTYRWDNGYLTNLTQSGSAPYRQPGW
jgi:Tol biopolymer transport system component